MSCCCCGGGDDTREKLLNDSDVGGSGANGSDEAKYKMLAPTLSEEGLPHYKITVLGSGGVGKSALTLRLVSGKFQQEYDPTIEDSYRLKLFIPNEYLHIDFTQNSFHTAPTTPTSDDAKSQNNSNGASDGTVGNLSPSNNSSNDGLRHSVHSVNSKYANRNLNVSNSHARADMDGQLISMEILDTAGQEEFITLRDQWINHSDGFLLVYGVDSRSTLEETKNIFKLIEKNFEDEIDELDSNRGSSVGTPVTNGTNSGGSRRGSRANRRNFVIPCVLVGNKCDLIERERECEFSHGQTFANSQLRGIPFFETSAKNQINNKECFYEIIRLIQMNMKWKYQQEMETHASPSDGGGCMIL